MCVFRFTLAVASRFFFFLSCGDRRDLHSFPTRRSSDLVSHLDGLARPSSRSLLVMSWARTVAIDRKSTRLNSSHTVNSYAGFCLKKKKRLHHARRARHSGQPDLAGRRRFRHHHRQRRGVFFGIIRPPARATLFPYTTLFR